MLYIVYMLSLYIHIPFCDFKCGYCSFTVVSTQDKPAIEKLIDPYVLTVCQEIRDRSAKLGKQTEIKSIYIGGGTPTRIGKQNLHRIIDTIIDTFNTELLAELTIECNPFPQEEVLDIITSTQNRYTSFPRVRRSIGIQTFDGEILKESSRMYSFPAISQFLRDLQVIKQQHTLYNLDFIAFGKRQTNKKGEKNLRHSNQREFFLNLVESHMADSFSVYTLELFPGSTWYNDQIPTNSHHKQGLSLQKYGTDDEVYDEFLLLRSTLQDADYHRYEISNFCLPAKSSIHNRVYRNMEDYIGIGVSAASFIDLHHNPDRAHLWPDQQQARALRRTNTKEILAYIQ
jgi:oxygen-independent coproporphyrinogen III oxidase